LQAESVMPLPEVCMGLIGWILIVAKPKSGHAKIMACQNLGMPKLGLRN
jgi:hypothetical protein